MALKIGIGSGSRIRQPFGRDRSVRDERDALWRGAAIIVAAVTAAAISSVAATSAAARNPPTMCALAPPVNAPNSATPIAPAAWRAALSTAEAMPERSCDTLASTAVVIERLAERSLILQLYTAGIFKHILLVPDCHDLISLRSSIRRVGGTLSIRVASDRPSRLAAFGKRAFDLGAGGLALVLLSPLLVTLAVAVRLDGEGPVIFSQPRWGGGDGTFRALKFRTMHTDGERRLRRHFLHNPAAEREYERYRKLDNDPRVTRVGRIMRATSLDELPQLVNVMRGEMSLVGPRPYTLDELSRLGPARQILSVALPGITGFWQVSGRNQRTFRERIEMDCYYVRNLSIWLDLWILYRTVIGVITREGK